jgi:homoserine/homoserine lactone efflux protein
MSWHGWTVFAAFWVFFVTTPGPNAVNCIQNGMNHGFHRSLWGVLGILTQATLFLLLSAAGVTALIAASPTAFFWAKIAGAVFLVWFGLRGWLAASRPVTTRTVSGRSIWLRSFLLATINAKSVAGYLAAFSQFVEPGVPIWQQMRVIVPTALTITAVSYTAFTALGAGLGRVALGAVLNAWFRRAMAVAFLVYGALLGASAASARP